MVACPRAAQRQSRTTPHQLLVHPKSRGRQSSDKRGGGAAATQAVGFEIHDLAEDMRMHGEQCAEEHRGPAQLWNMIQPTAQDENEKITCLVHDVERRLALESVTRKVVDR